MDTDNSKAKEVLRFLRTNSYDTLIFNGYIIVGWQLNQSGKGMG